MKLAVCVKQVPDTGDLRIDPETNTLIREGVDSVMNPLDEFPLETALQLRERYGGTVTVITMGPPQAESVLRKALAMGADDGALVSDRAFAGADTWATSLTLSRALQQLGPFDLILCGKQAIDGDTAQVGPGIAAHLGIGQVTYVTHVHSVDQGKAMVTRMFEGGSAVLRCRLPVVMTILKEANEPRLPTLSGRLRSFRQELLRLGAAELGLNPQETGLNGSPTRVVSIGVPNVARDHVRLTGNAEECVNGLLREMIDRSLLNPLGKEQP